MWRRIAEGVDAVPAAQLNLAELRVIECIPVNVALALVGLIAPFEQLQVILNRMLAEPVNVLIARDSGFAHRAPDLNHPTVRAQLCVEPILRASNNFLWVIFELVKHADRRVARELFALLALRLEYPQILRWHIVIGFGAERSQQHAAPGMEKEPAANVAMVVDELHASAYFWLTGREIAGTQLLTFSSPFFGKVAI